MTPLVREAVDFVQSELSALSDPDKAAGMQAYMRNEILHSLPRRR